MSNKEIKHLKFQTSDRHVPDVINLTAANITYKSSNIKINRNMQPERLRALLLYCNECVRNKFTGVH